MTHLQTLGMTLGGLLPMALVDLLSNPRTLQLQASLVLPKVLLTQLIHLWEVRPLVFLPHYARLAS